MKRCITCNRPHSRNADECQACYSYRKRHPGDTPKIPQKGIIIEEHDELRCHVCGRLYSRLIPHARQAHNLTKREYCDRYQFLYNQQFTAQKTHNLSSRKNKEHHDLVVKENLLKKGQATRFKKGQYVPLRGHHLKGGE